MEQNLFSRSELLFGTENLQRLHQASVAVFGVGGVGSFAAEALCRGGIGRLTLIDFDSVCISNCNRQIHATSDVIGRPKVLAMAERCRAINPGIEVEPIQEFYSAENSGELLSRKFDFVCDCIDNITAKLHLIQACTQGGIPIIASMGAANKIDPSKIQVGDLFHTQKCRLARIMRKELRRRGIHRGVRAVYSTEEFRPLTGGRAGSEGAAQPTGGDYQQRRAPLGSSSYIPPLFGLTLAGEVIRSLIAEEECR